MSKADPITMLVLGPMRVSLDGGGMVVKDSRTRLLIPFFEQMVAAMREELPELGEIHLDTPDEKTSNSIIPGILNKLETCDIAICDLTGGSANVMYELGIVNALGIPFILVTGDDRPPFYVLTHQCIAMFDPSENFDRRKEAHRLLHARLLNFMALSRDVATATGHLEDYAANPVSDYFNGLPIVDISAPVGLAAGYWMNAVGRFVRRRGYFDPPIRQVTLEAAGRKRRVKMQIREFVAVEPVEGLRDSYLDDLAALLAILRGLGFGLIKGAIAQADEHDLRSFGAWFLAEIGAEGRLSVIDPGIVVEIPTTLYALRYSPRIMRIDDRPLSEIRERDVVERLRRRRYRQMLERFGRLIDHYLSRPEAKEHAHQVHYVRLDELPILLARIVRPRSST